MKAFSFYALINIILLLLLLLLLVNYYRNPLYGFFEVLFFPYGAESIF